MDRTARLQSGRSTLWVQKYTGKNIIRGYSKWYGVDKLSAVIELRQLGVSISAAREEEIRLASVRRSTAPKTNNKEFSHSPDSDDTFAFIAGYTPAGCPYGVTWEEMEETPARLQEEESEPDF